MYLKNWAQNVTFKGHVASPEDNDELSEVILEADKIHAFGARNSFNTINDSVSTHVDMIKFKSIVISNTPPMCPTVKVGAGVTLAELSIELNLAGYALPNLPTLSHITVVGACTTSSHGSGSCCLSTFVSGIDIVDYNGNINSYDAIQNPDIFDGLIISFGSLGIVSSITLNIIPRYDMTQTVYTGLNLLTYLNNFEKIMFKTAYSVSCFTDLDFDVKQVWVKDKIHDDCVDVPLTFFGAAKQLKQMHPSNMDPTECTTQMGIPGSWHRRLPLRGLHESSLWGASTELQSEFFVAADVATEAIQHLTTIRDEFKQALIHCEIRTVSLDTLWLSPACNRRSVTIHFSWINDIVQANKSIKIVTEALKTFEPRPHWGKLFTYTKRELESMYPKLERFNDIKNMLDPFDKFSNKFFDTYIAQEIN